MGGSSRTFPFLFPPQSFFWNLGPPTHGSWTLGSCGLTPLMDKETKAWREKCLSASSLNQCQVPPAVPRDCQGYSSSYVEPSAGCVHTSLHQVFRLAGQAFFILLTCALDKTERLSDLHEETQLASGWPGFRLKVHPASKPMLSPWMLPVSTPWRLWARIPEWTQGHSAHPCPLASSSLPPKLLVGI